MYQYQLAKSPNVPGVKLKEVASPEQTCDGELAAPIADVEELL